MKLLVRYLYKEKRNVAFLFILISLNFFLILTLYNMPTEVFFYAEALSVIIFVGYLGVGYYQFYHKYKILEKSMFQKHLFEFQIEGNQGILEQKYSAFIDKLINEKNDLISDQNTYISDMTDYYTIWAHQIKTPISALNLMFQVLPENTYQEVSVKELKQELFKIEFYTEAVLQYLRLESINSDFRFELYKLDRIIKKCIKKFSAQFIYKKIKLELGDINAEVLTDEKWIGFVIEQLLSNAVKYTKNGGCVHIYLKSGQNSGDWILVIEDSGIGISEEDLPRIFERGFTGYNGRMDKKSTGIGLYLCKKTLNKLNHKIWIDSKYGVGTSVFIDFKKKDMRFE